MKTLLNRLVAALLLIFALAFTANANALIVGAEDISLTWGDKDYNDLVFSLTGSELSLLGAGSWLPMTAPNQDGVQYWDTNSSWDTDHKGIGQYISELSLSQPQYWGMPGGGASNSFWFHSAGGSVNATILQEKGVWASFNQLFWYDTTSNPNILHFVFAGSDSAGATTSFTPSENFGLMLSSPSGNFRTRGAGQQFTVFQESAVAPVPEPGTYTLMGAGLILFIVGRRWQH